MAEHSTQRGSGAKKFKFFLAQRYCQDNHSKKLVCESAKHIVFEKGVGLMCRPFFVLDLCCLLRKSLASSLFIRRDNGSSFSVIVRRVQHEGTARPWRTAGSLVAAGTQRAVGVTPPHRITRGTVRDGVRRARGPLRTSTPRRGTSAPRAGLMQIATLGSTRAVISAASVAQAD